LANDFRLLVFALDGRRFALPLSIVERAEPAVAVAPLPKAPDGVLGLINWRGRMLAVYDCRSRFGLAARDPLLSDRFILARTRNRMVVLAVDAVEGIVACPADKITPSGGDLPQFPYVGGVAMLADGTVVIHDIDTFLSQDQEAVLAAALAEAGAE